MTGGRRGRWTFLIVAVVLAAVFGRLGVWQLERLAERRAANRFIEARMDLPPGDLASAIDSDTPLDSLVWRRFLAHGAWDRDHEIVIRGRASHGTPGVHVVTPLVLGPDIAVLVLRGWLPAADGLRADLSRARAHDPGRGVELEGLALASEAPSRIPARTRSFEGADRLVLGTLSIEQAAESVPYDLLPVFLLMERTDAGGRPAPVQAPAPSDGPHLWYAVQWFGFAVISLVGSLLYIRSRGRSASPEGNGT